MDIYQRMDLRRRVLIEKDIEKLFKLYRKKQRDNDFVGARKIEFVLSKQYGIEGDRRYDISQLNGDFEG